MNRADTLRPEPSAAMLRLLAWCGRDPGWAGIVTPTRLNAGTPSERVASLRRRRRNRGWPTSSTTRSTHPSSARSREGSYFLNNVVSTVDRDKRAGSYNWSLYSNPRLDALTQKSFTLLDPDARETVLQEAVQVVADDLPIIPLFHLALVWGVRAGLRFEANMSGYTAATMIRRAV